MAASASTTAAVPRRGHRIASTNNNNNNNKTAATTTTPTTTAGLKQQQHRKQKLQFIWKMVLFLFLLWFMTQGVLLLLWLWWWPSSQQSQRRQVKGIMNGIIPMELIQRRRQQPPFFSTIHCVGETFLNNSWWYRSCHFTNLCYHMTEKEFHFFSSNHEEDVEGDDERNNHHWFHNITNHSLSASRLFYSSTLVAHNRDVSPGGIVAEEARRYTLPWFPRVIPFSESSNTLSLLQSYWHIPSRPVVVPFFPRLANNAGHLIWDNWLPLYQLLHMFLLLPEEQPPLPPPSQQGEATTISSLFRRLLRRHDNENDDTTKTLSSSPHILIHNLRTKGRCRILDRWCRQHMIDKFLPMLGIPVDHFLDLTKSNFTFFRHPTTTTTTANIISSLSSSSSSSIASSSISPYLCFDHAVAGLGVLTDHGTNERHGQYLPDYLHPHNAVRGPILYDFRTWVLRNLQLQDKPFMPMMMQQKQRDDDDDAKQAKNPIIHQITVSVNSTKDPFRYWNANDYIHAMQQELLLSSSSTSTADADANVMDTRRYHIQSVVVSKLTAKEQIQLALQSTMYLTVAGGGSVTAMWLPPGASLILFYPVLTVDQLQQVVESTTKRHKRQRQSDLFLTNTQRLLLDWDVWNHLSYIHVHWLPLPTTTTSTTTITQQLVSETTSNSSANGSNATTVTTKTTVADINEQEQSIQLLLHLIRHELTMLPNRL